MNSLDALKYLTNIDNINNMEKNDLINFFVNIL